MKHSRACNCHVNDAHMLLFKTRVGTCFCTAETSCTEDTIDRNRRGRTYFANHRVCRREDIALAVAITVASSISSSSVSTFVCFYLFRFFISIIEHYAFLAPSKISCVRHDVIIIITASISPPSRRSNSRAVQTTTHVYRTQSQENPASIGSSTRRQVASSPS